MNLSTYSLFQDKYDMAQKAAQQSQGVEVLTTLEKQSLLSKWPGLETRNLPTAFV